MAKYATSNIYFGVRCTYQKNMTCYPNGYGLFKGRPGHDGVYDAFLNTPAGFMSITTAEILPVYDEEVYIKKNYACELEPIVYYMEDEKIPICMTEEEIINFVTYNYSGIKRAETYKKMEKKREL